MRLKLEAQPGELGDRAPDLLGELSKALAAEAPELADQLAKALPRKEPELKHPVLRALRQRVLDAYEAQIRLLTADVRRVIDGAVRKSADDLGPISVDSEGDWQEVPEAVGAALWQSLMSKGAGHKYIRRVPTGKAKPKYRYYYNVTGGRGLGHEDELKVGAAFKMEHEGRTGHFHVKSADDQQVELEHDESGKTVKLTKTVFQRMLHDQHLTAIGEQVKRAQSVTDQAKKTGTAKQVARAEQREQQLRQQFPAHPEHRQEATEPEKRQEPKPEPEKTERPKYELPAPALERATLADMGPGGWEQVETLGASAEELEAQAQLMDADREYAVIAQPESFLLVSKPRQVQTGPKVEGGQTEVFLKNDRGTGFAPMSAKWMIVEADQVIPSHNAVTFQTREDYPEGVQERRYDQIKEEQDKIERIANTLEPRIVANTNPDAINGAPIVTEDGVVLGGNGRTMGIQRAYELYGDRGERLKQHLARTARTYGISPSAVQGMRRPILVRQVQAGKDREQLTRLGRRMNEALTQGLDPRSQEVAVSKFVTQDVVDSLTHHMEADQPLLTFLGGKESRPFVDTLLQHGIIDQYNRSKFVDQESGLLNEDGRTRVVRVLAARMLPDAKLLDSMDQSLRANLAQAVPYFLQAEAAGWDLRKHLRAAVEADRDMRNRDYKRNAGGRADYLGQTVSKVLDPDNALHAAQHPVARALLEVIHEHNGPRKLSRGMKALARTADEQAHDYGAQASMFARPKVEPPEALARAFGLKDQLQEQKAAALEPPTWEKAQKQDAARGRQALTWEAQNIVRAALASVDEPDAQQLVDKLRRSLPDLRADPEIKRLDVQPQELLQLIQTLLAAAGHPVQTEVQKGLLSPTEPVMLFEPSRSVYHIDLQKARAHKYLSRHPNPKPPPKWQYTYEYTSRSQWGGLTEGSVRTPVEARIREGLHVGIKIRDQGLGDEHGGHWELVAKEEGRLTFKHDETGETKTFEGESEVRSWVREMHEQGVEAETRRRRERSTRLAHESYQAYQDMRKSMGDRAGEGDNVYRLQSQWQRVVRHAKAAGWSEYRMTEWAELLGVPPVDFYADSPAKLRRRLMAVLPQVRKHSREPQPQMGETTSPELARAYAEYKLAHDALVGGRSSMMAEVELDELHKLWEEKPGDLQALVKQLAKKGRGYAYKARKWNNIVLRGRVTEENYWLARTVGDFLEQNGGYTNFGQSYLQHVNTLSSQLREYAESAGGGLVTSPELLGDQAPDFKPEFDPAKLEAKNMEFRLSLGDEPVFPMNHAQYKNPVWGTQGEHRRIIEEHANRDRQRLRKEHQRLWAQHRTIYDEVLKQTADFDLEQHWRTSLEAAAKDLGGTAEQVEKALRWGLSTQPMEYKFALNGMLREIFADEGFEQRQARAKPLLDAHRARDAQELAKILGGPHDVQTAVSRLGLQEVTDDEQKSADSSYGRQVKVRPYDMKADNQGLGQLLPLVTPEVAPEVRVLVTAERVRGHCTYDNTIRVTDQTASDTMWHEYGHAIEHAVPGIKEAANVLRNERSRGERRRKLNDIQETTAYDDHEEAYEDKWFDVYTGKWYGLTGSTEVLSMGVQYLMTEGLGFRARDPDHFAFTVAALGGRLGKREAKK